MDDTGMLLKTHRVASRSRCIESAPGHAGRPGGRLLLVLLLALPLVGASALAQQPLRVGIYQNTPKVFLGEDGSAQGFFPALIDEIAARLRLQVVYVPCTWAACLDALAAGDIDLLPDVAFSRARAERIRFGHESALHAVSYLYARSPLDTHGIDVLDGSRVAVVLGSIQRDHVSDLAAERGWQVDFVDAEDMRSTLERVADGQADFGIVNDYFGEAVAPELGLVRTRFVLQPTPLFFAYRPDVDSGLVARIDTELAALVTAWRYRRRARGTDAALRMSRERLAAITEAVALGVWEWDPETDQLLWDASMYRLYGIDPESAVRRFSTWLECVHPDDRPRIRTELRRVMEEGETLDTEFRIIRPDGEVRHVKANGQTGRGGRLFGINLDITRMHSLEEQLRQTQKMEALGALTGGIAHDFNNMLMVISSNLELAREEGDAGELAALLDDAVRAAERGTELTRRLLTFSRRQVFEAQDLDLADQIRRTTTFLNRIIPERIAITTRIDSGVYNSRLDPGQLENALVNLAINARDAMPEDGRLLIGCDSVDFPAEAGSAPPGLPPGRYHRVIVQDDGSGMPEDVRLQAMDPFFTTKEVGEGTGLGLAMVYGFVRQSGGDIIIDSAPGRGTTITMYFPAAASTPGQAAVSPVTSSASFGEGLRVLVVEDDPGVRQLLEKVLDSLGMVQRPAVDALSALAVLDEEGVPDLVLSDVVMPGGMTGIELAHRLRERWPDLPVILMSGYSAEREIGGAELPDGVVWLTKPFKRSELKAALDAVLHSEMRTALAQ